MSTIPIRVREEDWYRLMKSRGIGNIPERITELLDNEDALKRRIQELEEENARLEQQIDDEHTKVGGESVALSPS